MSDFKPYSDWPSEKDGRRYYAEQALGAHILDKVEYYLTDPWGEYAKLAPSATPEERQALVRKAASDAIYAVMMVLDGITANPLDETHFAQYVLGMRVLEFDRPSIVDDAESDGGVPKLHPFHPPGTQEAESIELMPEGDGLCYAFHGWYEADQT